MSPEMMHHLQRLMIDKFKHVDSKQYLYTIDATPRRSRQSGIGTAIYTFRFLDRAAKVGKREGKEWQGNWETQTTR